MQNRLFLLSVCVLLSGCVYKEQQGHDIYAQSDLLPPKNISEKQELYPTQLQNPNLTLQGQQTPAIVIPQQTVLPSHVLATPQMPPLPQNNPTPFVQTIVIPQATPYSYPSMPPQQTPAINHTINGQMYPTQTTYPNQIAPLTPQNYPSQNTGSPQTIQPVWANPQSVQQIQPEVFQKPLNTQPSDSNNIPRW